MATIEGQISVNIAREENGAKVDLEGDGLYSTVHTNVPFRCHREHTPHVHELSCNIHIVLQRE